MIPHGAPEIPSAARSAAFRTLIFLPPFTVCLSGGKLYSEQRTGISGLREPPRQAFQILRTERGRKNR